MWQEKYNKGIDEMLEKENLVNKTYPKVCYSVQGNEYKPNNKAITGMPTANFCIPKVRNVV